MSTYKADSNLKAKSERNDEDPEDHGNFVRSPGHQSEIQILKS